MKPETFHVCLECGTNCHKKCEKFMPNHCGINNKILATELAKVERDSTRKSTATRAQSSVSSDDTYVSSDSGLLGQYHRQDTCSRTSDTMFRLWKCTSLWSTTNSAAAFTKGTELCCSPHYLYKELRTHYTHVPDAKFQEAKSDYLGPLIVAPEIVAKKIKAMKDNKSPGADGIPPKLLMETVEQISISLARVFRESCSF